MVFMDYQALYDEWLTSPCFDEATKAELRGISEEEKKDRFYTELEFGTAGLRGVIGAGLNRMNIYTVRKATHRIRFPSYVSRICQGSSTLSGCKWH